MRVRRLALALAACASSSGPSPPIANAGAPSPPPPTWCDDVVANRLDRAGLPLRPLLEREPFDREAVLAFLRAQPCVATRLVVDDQLGALASTAAIAEIRRVGATPLKCKAHLDRDAPGRATFTMKCAPK